jgi:DNA-directed RNA polymerase specialized sigma24 family protein
MEQPKPKRREATSPSQTEQLLATYYSQLLKWGAVLTRGDVAKAQDIVQEFCLYFTLTKPDLSEVANLDGYLYTCLRHIYLSDHSRASREALRFVNIADFDSFDFAISVNQLGDPLQRQNDLRRICSYAVWRKEQSKIASYFILHFFHGYTRREIAELACLPIAAIYNKLKAARNEVKSHLDKSGKLRIIDRDSAPIAPFSWSLLSPIELFKELRNVILDARAGTCLIEETLLAHYRSIRPNPISCSLLSHIVSCERCLDIIGRHFRRPMLKDRDPLDGFGSSADAGNRHAGGPNGQAGIAMLQAVRRRWGRIHEHRPATLSIAVNGKIVASHDVQSQHSTLSVRIEHSEREQFVEVFSEQDVRLALLSVGELPPNGPHVMTQRVTLSDSRWLELNLTFDGLGLNSQVAYFDPALAISAVEDQAEDLVLELAPPVFAAPVDSINKRLDPRPSWIRVAFIRYLRPLVPSSAPAWALLLVTVVGATGFLTYRHAKAPMTAEEILNQSLKIETASLQRQTEHQVIQVEEVSADGRILQRGAVDLWKDGDGGRYVRRLYDSQHRVIAARWSNRGHEHSSTLKEGDKSTHQANHSVSMAGFWDQDLSANAFKMLGGKESHLVNVEGGYELTTVGPISDRPQLISAALVLDNNLRPVRQTIRAHVGAEIHEIRFVQTSFERKPSADVPDMVFDPEHVDPQAIPGRHSSISPQEIPDLSGNGVKLAQLQIAVLYQLNSLGADIGEPIEVLRTTDARIRVSGTVANDNQRLKIVSHLETLEDHQLLDLRLLLPRDMREQAPVSSPLTQEETSVYEIGQGKPIIDATLSKYFQTKGLSGDALNSSVERYSRDVLQHAQRALQNAYALDRLGRALSVTELKSIGLSSQQQWAEMVNKHASDLKAQLNALHGQFSAICPQSEGLTDQMRQLIEIENSAQFNSAANQILNQTRQLNGDIGRLFTFNPSGVEQSAPNSLLASSMRTIPLLQAEEISRFAARLKASERSTLTGAQRFEDEGGVSKQQQ